MARRPARRRDESTDETAVDTTETVDATQEGSQAPELSEENAVTVTEPEVDTTPESVDEAPEAAQPDEAPEAAQADEAPEAAQADASAAAPAEEKAEKSKEDFEGEFRQAVEDGVELADVDTGSVPEIGLDKVLTAYRLLPSTASKSAVKNWLGEEMRDALINGKIPRARALADINSAVQEASTRRSAAAPAKPSKSPTEVYLDAILTLDMAKQFTTRPSNDDLEENWEEQYHQRYSDYQAEGGPVATYLGWLNAPEAERGDEPEVDQVIKNAAKVAAGKGVSGGRKSTGARRSSGGTSSGVRRNVASHIEEFLAQADPSQEYTVAEVANFNSTEYGEDHPSPGAVAARLFPGGDKASTIEGFVQVEGAEPKKIRKA